MKGVQAKLCLENSGCACVDPHRGFGKNGLQLSSGPR
jgi:hypothetical protein